MTTESNFPHHILNQRKLKATTTRIALLNLLKDRASAAPLSEIQKAMENTDRITLYRTLQTLIKKGIIHKAMSDPSDTYYALCGGSCTANAHSHNHVHFRCTTCQRVTCEQLKQPLLFQLDNYTIESVQVILKGICPACH